VFEPGWAAEDLAAAQIIGDLDQFLGRDTPCCEGTGGEIEDDIMFRLLLVGSNGGDFKGWVGVGGHGREPGVWGLPEGVFCSELEGKWKWLVPERPGAGDGLIK